MQTLSLKWRIGLHAAVVLVLAGVLIGAIAWFEFREAAIDSLDYRLRSNADMISNLIQDGESVQEVHDEIAAALRTRGKVRPWGCRLWFDDDATWFATRDRIDGLFERFQAAAGPMDAVPEMRIVSYADGDRPLRVIWARYHVHVAGGTTGRTLNIFGYVSEVHVHHELLEFTQAMLLAGGIVIAVGIVGLMGALHVGLRPLERLIDQMERIPGAGSQDRELETLEPIAELRRFVQAWKRMLARLWQAMDANRRFTSDASHELRTPLAVVKSTLQLARSSKRSAQQYEQAIDRALEDLERVNGLIDDLLELSRLDDQGVPRERVPCAMQDMVRDVVGMIQGAAVAAGRQVQVQTCPVTVIGQAGQLRGMPAGYLVQREL